MAAYASLVSLMNTMEQIKNHPRFSISFDKNQIESLLEKVAFLQDFMESHSHGSSKEAEVLERQIASATHAAEDVIESHVADQVVAGYKGNRVKSSLFWLILRKVTKTMDTIHAKFAKVKDEGRFKDLQPYSNSSPVLLDLRKVMEDMETIHENVMKVKEEGGFEDLQPNSTPASSSAHYTTGKSIMVGFEDYLIQLKDMLTGQRSNRQVIPIVGMGGIGKTTLARNVFESSLIVNFFDICAWVTVSQNYSVREIILQLLLSCHENSESFIALDECQLGVQLRKCLWNRRYLIILDDIWGIEVWNKLSFYFPDNNNFSRIVVTTRLKDVATQFGSSYLAIDFLDEDKSWNLFCEKAFGQQGCPIIELEEVGKKIAKNCKGLPLSIVVIGGFLRKSYKPLEYWETVARDTNSILNSAGEEQCLNILSLSYSHLPVHLKPCFLYMGVFPEDHEIRVSRLIKLWTAEGFLKPTDAQSLEEVAEGYLTDLVDRNLILVRTWGSNGKIKACNIHDLLRELCLRVATKEKFFCVMESLDTPRALNWERHIVIHESYPIGESHRKVFYALESAVRARSLLCKGRPPFKFGLLRVLVNTFDEEFDRGRLEAYFQFINLRCLDRQFVKNLGIRITSSPRLSSLYLPLQISQFWNLQTINIKGCSARIIAPSEIWEMSQLRHLNVGILSLPDPPTSDRVDHILQNLQTLSRAENFRLSEEVCKRIPNIKKLRTMYADLPKKCEANSYYCPQNLSRFHKLESLNFYFDFWERDFWLNVTFPSSLKKLSLYGTGLYWEDMSMIGSLPHLEVLKLESYSVQGSKWSPIEGKFRRLKFLKIWSCHSLHHWNAESFHFPVLETLVLEMLSLRVIPSGIGEIPTLRCIRLKHCPLSCAISALEILVEQESQGNEDLHIEVQFFSSYQRNFERFWKEVEEKGITSNNLHVTCGP